MNKARSFLLGEIDILDLGDGIILSRERTNRKCDLWHFSDGKKDLKQLWVNEDRKHDGDKKKQGSFQTGGKKPYSMHLDEEYHALMESKDSKGDLIKQFGIVSVLQYYAEFNTGRLVNRRTKKSLTRDMMADSVGVKHGTFYRLVKDMISNGLIEKKSDGYYISRKFVKKGAKKDEIHS